MALPELTSAVCGKLVNEFDKTLNTLLGCKAVMNPMLEALKAQLNNTVFSPPASLLNGINQVNALINQIPALDTVRNLEELARIVAQCAFFNVSPMLKNPVNLIRGLQQALNTDFYGKILNIGSALGLPELGLGNDISKIQGFMDKFRLDNLIPTTNLAIQCINKICNIDISQRLARYNLLEKALHLTSGGALNLPEIYNLCNLSSVAISNMTLSVASVGSIVDGVNKNISTGVAAVKKITDWVG
jgi:hypothetical protein